jgi:hypothetical protein
MSTLLPVATARALIATDLDDTQLGAVIDREEAMLIAKFGPHGDGASSVTATIDGCGGELFLPRPVASVVSVGGAAWASLGATLYADQGRICGGRWGAVTVVYVPADDRDDRRAALIDLVRLAIQRTAMQAESVAGEYSYTAPTSWEAARASIYRRLMFMSV